VEALSSDNGSLVFPEEQPPADPSLDAPRVEASSDGAPPDAGATLNESPVGESPAGESSVTDTFSVVPVVAVSMEPAEDKSRNGTIAPLPFEDTMAIDQPAPDQALNDEPIESMPTDQWIDIPPIDPAAEVTPAADQPVDEPHAQPETQSDPMVTEPQENEPSISAGI